MDSSIKFPNKNDVIKIKECPFSFAQVNAVVFQFYQLVSMDELLKKPFSSVEDWPHHIENLTHFWWCRLGGQAYLQVTYNPVEKHFQAGFNPIFLKRWLELFREVLKTNLSPEQVEIWASLAERMGNALSINQENYARMRQAPQ
jgi:hemoglobin